MILQRQFYFNGITMESQPRWRKRASGERKIALQRKA
jgi:hypothetical protein